VTITGSDLTGATAVMFGTVAASSFTVNSATKITVTSPAATGLVDVTVVTPGGTSATSSADQFSYAPVVTGISPAQGPAAGGTTVTITGSNLTGTTAVKFGTVTATSFTVNSATKITVTSPAGTVGLVDVTVVTPGGTSATSSADLFSYAPVVTGISPSLGPAAGGTTVTITGSNLTGVTAVKFGTVTVTSFTVNSATKITVTSPAGTAGTVDVTVVAPGGTSATSSADQFSYAPVVTGISPSQGPAGRRHDGDNHRLEPNRRHSGDVWGVAASSFTVKSATQITATSPAGTAGTVDVTVVTPGGRPPPRRPISSATRRW